MGSAAGKYKQELAYVRSKLKTKLESLVLLIFAVYA